MKHVDVIIIGGGPAGISAAIWCQRLGTDYLLLEKEAELGGQLPQIHNKIIDYPGLHAKNGKEIQAIFETHFNELGCSSRLRANVLAVDTNKKTVTIRQHGEIHFTYLVIATGAAQRFLGVPGEKEMILRGETYSATADSHLFKGKRVAVVGGGDRAFEGAILLAEAGVEVLLIHRSQNFKAQKQYVDLVFSNKNIKILTDSKIIRINGEERVTSVDLVNQNNDVLHLPVDAVLIRIGTKPNNEIVQDIVVFSEEGFILTNSLGKTSNPFIYAIGDICTQPLFSSIASSVGQGAVVAKHLSSLIKQRK
jgi:thioredoxin reductase (NADPH)